MNTKISKIAEIKIYLGLATFIPKLPEAEIEFDTSMWNQYVHS